MKKFKDAFNGLKLAFKQDFSFKLMLIIAFIVILLAFIFKFNKYEMALVLMSCSLVLGLELINSSIEELANIIQPQYDLRIKKVKDLAAAGVLVASILSGIIGIVLLMNKIWR